MGGLFHLLLGSFCCFTALLPKDTAIGQIRCFCFKKVHSCKLRVMLKLFGQSSVCCT